MPFGQASRIVLACTGGQTRMLGISKNVDRRLRTLLMHVAKAVVRHAHKRDDYLGRWVRKIEARRGRNRTVVALANKVARSG